MNRIRKGDEVVVIAGKDKGKKGKIIRVIVEDRRVVVEGINKIKRHQKPNPQRQIAGGIVEMESPMHVSNVALADPKSGKPTRVGYKIDKGNKVRIARRSGEVING